MIPYYRPRGNIFDMVHTNVRLDSMLAIRYLQKVRKNVSKQASFWINLLLIHCFKILESAISNRFTSVSHYQHFAVTDHREITSQTTYDECKGIFSEYPKTDQFISSHNQPFYLVFEFHIAWCFFLYIDVFVNFIFIHSYSFFIISLIIS